MAQLKIKGKPTLVFLPGTLCTNAMFQPFLQSDYYHSITIDLHVENSLSQTTQLIKQTVKESPIILVGFSMGGMLAFDFIRQYNEQVIGLCLLNSNCHEDFPSRKAGRDQHLKLAQQSGLDVLVNQVYMPVYFSTPYPKEAQLIVNMANSMGIDALKAQLKILESRPDSSGTLASFQKPILIIGAENDLPCPTEHQQKMAQLNTRAELHIVKDAGHFAPLEQNEQIKHLIELWIEKNYEPI